MSSWDRKTTSAALEKTFDTQFHTYVDKLIIISPFLEQHVKNIAPLLPYIIIPPIIDFEKYARAHNKPDQANYFLFCGSTHYTDVIEFILKAYTTSASEERGVSLILIINGNAEKILKLQDSIKQNKSITMLSRLAYDDLIGYYKNAKALLIPLQNNLQDQARFPFKISEYTAAARPIVTSDSGAVTSYFTAGQNALLAKTGDFTDFAEKLKFILDNPEKAEQIAEHGHLLGQQHFNYKSYSNKLNAFILSDSV